MTKHKTICGVDLTYFAKKPSTDELAHIIAGWDSVDQANFFIVLGEELRNQCAGQHAMQWEHIAVDLCRIEREIVHESGSELLEELAARIPNYGNYIHDSLDSGGGVIYIGFIKNGAKPMTTTNLPKLSTRAQKALDVLADGGKFVCRLERNGYTGREQFAYRLLKEGRVVRGIGLAAFYEIKDTFLTICEHNTSVSTYYQLRREA